MRLCKHNAVGLALCAFNECPTAIGSIDVECITGGGAILHQMK